MDQDTSFTSLLLSHWNSFTSHVGVGACRNTVVDGKHLDLATVVAVARRGGTVSLEPAAISVIHRSADVVRAHLEKGAIIYGVNTGFGGSADTRSSAVEELQKTLLRGLHYGVLNEDRDQSQWTCNSQSKTCHGTADGFHTLLPLDDPVAATCMPESWVRASMIVRLNSLASGASGVQLTTVETLAQLINSDIVPQVPIRGSISASGDLSPLSYIGGVMEGKPTLKAWSGNRLDPSARKLVRADEALAKAGIKPIIPGPKEGLAIVNGTAVSAGVAALALHEAHCQAALSQVLTAMTVEALLGTDESFNPFIARVRPHSGQVDSARNISSFLSQSRLIQHNDGSGDMTLRQDRYSIRTASQWIGPVLEDLALAHSQISIELNSATDNPLINIQDGTILHGGNFQAKSVSSAMEKVRAGIQTIGRMLFTQCTELINPATNRGLAPNLVVGEPSQSFIWKGTDIMIAALLSELGFLANPVAPHVQTAEMGNQALNSLALISARYTLDAVDVLSQLSAAHLMAVCQALDLRALHERFLEAFAVEFEAMVSESFHSLVETQDELLRLCKSLWIAFTSRLALTASVDSAQRLAGAVEALGPHIIKACPTSLETIAALVTFTEQCSKRAFVVYDVSRSTYRAHPDATPLLGPAAKRMYKFVRADLLVPFIGEEEITTPPPGSAQNGMEDELREQAGLPPTVGSLVSRIYNATRTGELYRQVMECLKHVEETSPSKY